MNVRALFAAVGSLVVIFNNPTRLVLCIHTKFKIRYHEIGLFDVYINDRVCRSICLRKGFDNMLGITFKKAIPLIVAAVLLLAGCGNGSSGNTAETEEKERVPVTDLFEGYEDLQGKDLEVFTLPETIEKPAYEKLYRFPDRRGGADVPEEYAKTKQLMKNCFGDKFDESLMTASDNRDNSKIYSFSLPEGLSAVVLHGFPINIVKSAEKLLTPQQEQLHCYSASEGDRTVELKNGSCTVNELTENMRKRLDSEIMQGLEGFELVPKSVYNYRNSNSVCYASIEYEVMYRGIKLDYDPPMSVIQQKNGYEVMTSYSANSVTLSTADKDDYAVLSSTFSEQYPLTEEVPEAISLKRAVRLLQSELAEYSRYEFDTVELRYCCRITAPVITGTDKSEDSRILADYGELNTAYFEPTWCFYYSSIRGSEKHREAVKVNALTGEITIDK